MGHWKCAVTNRADPPPNKIGLCTVSRKGPLKIARDAQANQLKTQNITFSVHQILTCDFTLAQIPSLLYQAHQAGVSEKMTPQSKIVGA
jgi:hypothetical protein